MNFYFCLFERELELGRVLTRKFYFDIQVPIESDRWQIVNFLVRLRALELIFNVGFKMPGAFLHLELRGLFALKAQIELARFCVPKVL